MHDGEYHDQVSLIPRHDPCGNLLVQLQIWVIRGNNIAGDIFYSRIGTNRLRSRPRITLQEVYTREDNFD